MNIQIDEFRLYKFFYVKQMSSVSWHDCRLSVLNEDSNKLYM